jgi:hypothetical protein
MNNYTTTTTTSTLRNPNNNKPATGAILWEGDSLLTGAPIVAIATFKSTNRKTDNSVQTWILCADQTPIAANYTGADEAICGNCPLRGIADGNPARKLATGRACYVNVAQAPTSIFHAYKRGSYPRISAIDAHEIGIGRFVRLGAYGDPAAVPARIWQALLSGASSHTAYSHQSAYQGADFKADMFMQSADSLEMARGAWRDGNRTFRLVASVADIDPKNEILCPASDEFEAQKGYKKTCAQCGLCNGTRKGKVKSIAIPAHGGSKKHAIALLK